MPVAGPPAKINQPDERNKKRQREGVAPHCRRMSLVSQRGSAVTSPNLVVLSDYRITAVPINTQKDLVTLQVAVALTNYRIVRQARLSTALSFRS